MPETPQPNILTRKQLKAMNKDQLIDYATAIGEDLTKLNTKLFDPKSGIIVQLQSQLLVSQTVNEHLLKKILLVERQSNRNEQYSRKESVEFHGMPLNIPNEQLESRVCAIMNEIKDDSDAPYSPVDLHACHHLKKKDRVIVKFVHRKRMQAIINRRRFLKNKNLTRHGITSALYLNESMSPPFKLLFHQCKLLRGAGKIASFWFYNGNLNVKLDENSDDRAQISHVCDLLRILDMSEEDFGAICGD